jgi:hypothetical protein
MEPTAGRYSADKLDPMIAMYKGPELGPFICGNCLNFDGQGGCSIVAGPVDPQGHCNVWTPPDMEQTPEEAPMEAPVEALEEEEEEEVV